MGTVCLPSGWYLRLTHAHPGARLKTGTAAQASCGGTLH